MTLHNTRFTVNADEGRPISPSEAQMRGVFESHIINNPLDTAPRHIYRDWLEEHGRPTEAQGHRILANIIDSWHQPSPRHDVHHVLDRLRELHRSDDPDNGSGKSIQDYQPYSPVTESPALLGRIGLRQIVVRSKGRGIRLSTPSEASMIAHHNTNQLTAYPLHPMLRRWNEVLPDISNNHSRAIEAHYYAAHHHLQLASGYEQIGRFRYHDATLHRRAAIAHLVAAGIHENAQTHQSMV